MGETKAGVRDLGDRRSVECAANEDEHEKKPIAFLQKSIASLLQS